MNETFIIAEAGVNHNGDIDLAYKLIDVAISAGADAVKFQAAIPELVTTDYAQKAAYQKNTSNAKESQLEMIRKILLPIEKFKFLKKYSKYNEVFSFYNSQELLEVLIYSRGI